jgi:UDP-N-acetylmuramate-alanine ligase
MDSETDTPTRTRRLVRWLKDKIEKRRDERDDHDPWWVTLLLDVGRPVVAILILTMCAPGEHYLADALAALAAGRELGFAEDALVRGLVSYTGTKRRMERKGEVGGVRVYDSYAHHPTEIAGDLARSEERRGRERV